MMKKDLKERLAGFLVLIMVLVTVLNCFGGTYSQKWYATPDGRWQVKQNGVVLTSTWIWDDECDVSGGVWYLVDDAGNLVADKLVVDGQGHYFTFNGQHNGYYGALITTDGSYYGINLKFSQTHDGTFGSIINPEGIEALKKAYGVREFPNLINSKSVKLSAVNYVSSTGGSGGSYTPVIRNYWVRFNSNGVDQAEGMPEDRRVAYGDLVNNPVPATPSDPSKAKYCIGWFMTKDDLSQANEWKFDKSRVYGSTTLYAGWVDNECTVTFDANGMRGVSGMPQEQTVIGGSKLTSVASPSVPGYTLQGWYRDKEATSLWDFAKDIVTESMTLFALWKKDSRW